MPTRNGRKAGRRAARSDSKGKSRKSKKGKKSERDYAPIGGGWVNPKDEKFAKKVNKLIVQGIEDEENFNITVNVGLGDPDADGHESTLTIEEGGRIVLFLNAYHEESKHPVVNAVYYPPEDD